MRTQYFCFGEICVTAGATQELAFEEVLKLLEWHGQLKKGELCDEDYQENWYSLRNGQRIFSCFLMHGERYYVITEYDRSITTILKPEEY